MNYKSTIFTIAFLLFGLEGMQAQQTIPATGGEATGAGGTSSYTVGQTVYTTNTGTNGSEAQGVQQPYEISEITAIDQSDGIKLNCKVYPNPTTDNLVLEMERSKKTTYIAFLYDINGKQVKSIRLEGEITNIATHELASGTYFLRIMDKSKEVKSFKIIKNK